MRTIILLLAICGLMTACSKSSTPREGSQRIVGKWIQTQYLISPGPMGEWKPYTGSTVLINFKEDGSFYAEGVSYLQDYSKYSVDGNRIYFTKTTGMDSLRLGLEFEVNNLILWEQCIEPCGKKLRRVIK